MALYFFSSSNCASVSLMLSGVSCVPTGIGITSRMLSSAYSPLMYFAMFLANTFSDSPFISPLYCSTDLPVMPLEMSELWNFWLLSPPLTVSARRSMSGMPMMPSTVSDERTWSTSELRSTRMRPPVDQK